MTIKAKADALFTVVNVSDFRLSVPGRGI